MLCTLINHKNDVNTIENACGTTSHRQVVSLQSFEHFDIIFLVNKSINHGKLLSICFYHNI